MDTDFFTNLHSSLFDGEKRSVYRLVGLAALLVLLLLFILGMWWSAEPESFSVRDNVQRVAEASERDAVVGSVTMATLIRVSETLLEKRGGYLSNDVMPPGLWLDNIPNWEFGVLVQVRDLSKAARESLSRSQSQSREDPDLAEAEPHFNFDSASWLLPPTESQYREGIEYLHSYLDRLSDPEQSNAQFYARADNLRFWLTTVESRLGSLSQRLSASVGRTRLNTDLAGEAAASQSTVAPEEVEVRTPWLAIDDVFYEARGTSWALIHFLKAVEIDFSDILVRKNALVSLRQIIRELESTQESVPSQMIINGSGFGLFANHSLVMASYISRANAALIDLRELLAQG